MARPAYLAAFEGAAFNGSIDSPPLVAFVTLRPVLNLILLSVDLQPLGNLILFPNLLAVLAFQLLLLQHLIVLVFFFLHLRIDQFPEVQELLRPGNTRRVES